MGIYDEYRLRVFSLTGVILFIFLSFSAVSSPSHSNTQFMMRLLSATAHFQVYFDGGEGSQSRIQELIDALEAEYLRIVTDLAVSDMPLVRAKIWSSRSVFYRDMEADLGVLYNGATGYVMGPSELRILLGPRSPIEIVHEFVHCVSLKMNMTIANNPRWLWETVACYLTKDFIHPRYLDFVAAGQFPSLDSLNADYNQGGTTIYDVGYILGEYIIETWGMSSLRNLILQNGDLKKVLGLTSAAFETSWHKWIEQKYLKFQ